MDAAEREGHRGRAQGGSGAHDAFIGPKT